MPGRGSVRVHTSGPLFNYSWRQIMNSQLHGFIQEVGDTGVKKLQQMMHPMPEGVLASISSAGKKVSQGNYRKNLHAQVDGVLGVVISDRGVVYGPWLEGTGSRNQTTRFKGYASFRRVRDWLERTGIPKAINKYEALIAKRLSGE
jgi:hypothetical protein